MKAENTKALYTERIRTIPKELRVLGQLEAQIEKTNKEKITLDNAWEQVQQELQKIKIQEQKTKATTNLEYAEKQRVETKAKREKMEVILQSLLEKSGFASEETYRAAKMLEEARIALKNEIQQFKQTRSLLQEQVKELEVSLKDKEEADLQQLEQHLQELKQAYETALNQWEQSKNFFTEATSNAIARQDYGSRKASPRK